MTRSNRKAEASTATVDDVRQRITDWVVADVYGKGRAKSTELPPPPRKLPSVMAPVKFETVPRRSLCTEMKDERCSLLKTATDEAQRLICTINATLKILDGIINQPGLLRYWLRPGTYTILCHQHPRGCTEIKFETWRRMTAFATIPELISSDEGERFFRAVAWPDRAEKEGVPILVRRDDVVRIDMCSTCGVTGATKVCSRCVERTYCSKQCYDKDVEHHHLDVFTPVVKVDDDPAPVVYRYVDKTEIAELQDWVHDLLRTREVYGLTNELHPTTAIEAAYYCMLEYGLKGSYNNNYREMIVRHNIETFALPHAGLWRDFDHFVDSCDLYFTLLGQ